MRFLRPNLSLSSYSISQICPHHEVASVDVIVAHQTHANLICIGLAERVRKKCLFVERVRTFLVVFDDGEDVVEYERATRHHHTHHHTGTVVEMIDVHAAHGIGLTVINGDGVPEVTVQMVRRLLEIANEDVLILP